MHFQVHLFNGNAFHAKDLKCVQPLPLGVDIVLVCDIECHHSFCGPLDALLSLLFRFLSFARLTWLMPLQLTCTFDFCGTFAGCTTLNLFSCQRGPFSLSSLFLSHSLSLFSSLRALKGPNACMLQLEFSGVKYRGVTILYIEVEHKRSRGRERMERRF